jgi:hypothetical protein
MNGDNNQNVGQGARWADITAVLSVVCVIGILYLPLIF